MYVLVSTKRYEKSIKKLRKSGSFDEEKLRVILRLLEKGKPLPQQYKDHKLGGNLKFFRECHLLPNLLLIYQVNDAECVIILANIGSHSELFG